MKFQVTQIEFDFTDEYSEDEVISDETKEEIVNDSLGYWEADDEDDLIEEITCATGWCIKSIDYVHLLESY